MQQSERKYKHLYSKHQIFKKNNNNYKKTLNATKGYKGLQKSQITIKYQRNKNIRKINAIQI